MLNECQKEEYSKAFNAKGEYNSTTKSLFMALIYQQHKMISKLIDKLSKSKQKPFKQSGYLQASFLVVVIGSNTCIGDRKFRDYF